MSENSKSAQTSANEQIVSKTVQINASVTEVWAALTIPALMQKWMTEGEIDILTDWNVGSPIVIRGTLHKVRFENRGTVLQFETEKRLKYSHLSSISRLPDIPESYSVIGFDLSPIQNQTSLTVTVSNFPTEAIYKHLAFYWNVAPGILKKQLELQTSPE